MVCRKPPSLLTPVASLGFPRPPWGVILLEGLREFLGAVWLTVTVYYKEGTQIDINHGKCPGKLTGVEFLSAFPCGAAGSAVLSAAVFGSMHGVLPLRKLSPALCVQSSYWGSVTSCLPGWPVVPSLPEIHVAPVDSSPSEGRTDTVWPKVPVVNHV